MNPQPLYHLTNLVADGAGPAEIYEAAVEAVMTAAGADRASILVFDDGGVMRFKAWRRLSPRYRAAVDGHSPWAADTKDASSILVPDVLSEPSLAALRDVIVSEGIRALAFIPLVHQHRLLGKFMVYYDAPHRFSDEELQVVRAVAHHVAFGLDRARAEEAIDELLERERVARHDAEAANRAKDDFLAMLAHELRNPLNVIVNAVGILDRTSSQEAGPARVRSLIRRQTDHLTRLLDDLLDVARINHARMELRTEPLDLRVALDLAVEAQRYRVEAKRQRLGVSVPDEAVVVLGDSVRLQQVVGNLLDNASKYTPMNGDISLTLTAEASEAVVRVRDSGAGIPRERLRSIFEPFTQLNPTLARTEGGLGIGLTLVKRLVELHEGTVEARSDGPGTGAEFVVRLPLAAAIPHRLQRPRFAPAAVVTPRSIVVVEDNDDARDALATALRLAGHRVQEAATGAAGVDLVGTTRPDVVLIDIGLPDIDGYEVARRLRDTLGASVRLVALTGYGQPEDRRRSAAVGLDAHLVKPVSDDRLLEVLGETPGQTTGTGQLPT